MGPLSVAGVWDVDGGGGLMDAAMQAATAFADQLFAPFAPEDYLTAFEKARLTDTERKMLGIHLMQDGYTLSSKFMAHSMGWNGNANFCYGKMAGRIGKIMGMDVSSLQYKSSVRFNSFVLVWMDDPQVEWEWTLRPAVVRALEMADKRGLLDVG